MGVFTEIQMRVEMDHAQIVETVKSPQNRCCNSVITADDKRNGLFGKNFPNGRFAVLKASFLFRVKNVYVTAVDDFPRLTQKSFFADGIIPPLVSIAVVAGGFPHAPGAKPGAGIY